MNRIGAICYKAAFIGRWYFWYNLELALLHSLLPKNVPLWSSAVPSEEAKALDQKRRKTQLAIFGLIRNYGSVCAACGACCKEKVNRFTAFDVAVRAAGPMPLKHYGKDILSLPWMLSNGLLHTGQRVWNAIRRRPAPEADVCENLGTSGCTLAHQDRPMLCASWFCPKYLRHMSHEDLKGIAPKLKEMERLHFEAYRLAAKSYRLKNQALKKDPHRSDSQSTMTSDKRLPHPFRENNVPHFAQGGFPCSS
jgi:hypothetical protein